VKSGLDDDFGWMWLFVDEHPWRHAHDWLESWLRGGARALNDAFPCLQFSPTRGPQPIILSLEDSTSPNSLFATPNHEMEGHERNTKHISDI
jgi:hypothetical protein